MDKKIPQKILDTAKHVGESSIEIGSSIFSNLTKPLEEKARRFIREKALERAKATIALSAKSIDELSEEDIEAIVAAEESKIVQEIQEKGIFAALAALGLSILGGW